MRKELIAFNDPKSSVSEMFKTLRTNIQFMNSDKELKTLLVSSTLPGEGKSWTAANLAVTFAQAGKKVLIIDADMRKGRQFNIFGIAPTPGLSNYLSGVVDGDRKERDLEDFVQKTEVENLYVMPAGNVPPNPSELLVSEKMIVLNKKVKELYDITIFDGTPSLLVTDAPILSRIVDSTILVTAHNETKIDNVAKVKKAIENIGGKVAGVVVNKIPVSSSKYGYGGGYYYYGGYGTTAPVVVDEKKSKHSKNIDFPWQKKSKFDGVEDIIKKMPFKHIQETENDEEETQMDLDDKPKEETQPVVDNEPKVEVKPVETIEPKIEVKPVETIEPKIEVEPIQPIQPKVEVKPVETIEPKIEVEPIQPVEPKVEAEPIETIESKIEVEPIQPIETKVEVKPVETVEPKIEVEPIQPIEPKVEIKPIEKYIPFEEPKTPVDYTSIMEANSNMNKNIENETTNNIYSANQYDNYNVYNEIKEEIKAETEIQEEDNPILSTTQDVIDQINKYLEEERRKLKNGGLND